MTVSTRESDRCLQLLEILMYTPFVGLSGG
jgi:hypothetical protein